MLNLILIIATAIVACIVLYQNREWIFLNLLTPILPYINSKLCELIIDFIRVPMVKQFILKWELAQIALLGHTGENTYDQNGNKMYNPATLIYEKLDYVGILGEQVSHELALDDDQELAIRVQNTIKILKETDRRFDVPANASPVLHLKKRYSSVLTELNIA